MSIGYIGENSASVGGFIESVSTMSGAYPPIVGTSSLLTSPFIIIVTLTISIGTRITQSTIPTTVNTLCPVDAGSLLTLSVCCFSFIKCSFHVDLTANVVWLDAEKREIPCFFLKTGNNHPFYPILTGIIHYSVSGFNCNNKKFLSTFYERVDIIVVFFPFMVDLKQLVCCQHSRHPPFVC